MADMEVDMAVDIVEIKQNQFDSNRFKLIEKVLQMELASERYLNTQHSKHIHFLS